MDIFAQEGLSVQKSSPSVDIFAKEGISPPSINEMNSQALAPKPLQEQPEELRAEVDSHTSQYEQLSRARFSQEQIDEWKQKPIGFLEARKFMGWSDVLPLGGIKQGYDTLGVYSIAKKMEGGEKLSDEETSTLNGFIDKNIEMNTRGFSFGGGVMYYGAKMPAFMAEFAATGGIGKAAQVAATKATATLATKGAMKAVAAKAAGLTANVAARTAVMPSLYVPKYGEQRLNDFMALTDKGQIIFNEAEESPAISAMKAFAHTSAEVASELSGAAIGKYVVAPVAGVAGKYLKTPLTTAIGKLPVAVRTNLFEAYKAINPNARVSKVFTAGGWNGMLEELGEERVADILHASLDLSTDKDFTFDDYLDAVTPDKDQLLIEAGIIAIAGGVRTSADVAFNILKDRGVDPKEARETVDNMTVAEQESLVETELKKKPEILADGAAARKISNPEATVSEDALADTATGSQVAAAQKAQPPAIVDNESTFEKTYREWWDGLAPIEKAAELAQERGKELSAGENPAILSRVYSGVIGMVRQNLQADTYVINKEGNIEITGKALKPILDDFDASVAHIEGDRMIRERDLNDYLIARRTMEDLKDREDVIVSQADLAKSVADLARLADKYGEEFQWFDTHAKEIYDYQKRILQNFVTSGNISQEQYDNILKANPNYVPFQRVLEQEEFKDMASSKGIFTNARASRIIKRITGSEKQIKNPIQSIIKNTAKVIQIAEQNRVARSVVALADVLPEYIQKTPPTMVKRGTAEVKVSFDAGLRRKLEGAIEFFENSIDRGKARKVKGHGYVRGYYSPAEKLVHVRIGTTEGTLAHEVGHMLDFEIGLMEKLLSDKTVKKELQELGDKRLSSQTIMTEKGEKVIFEDRVVDMSPEKYKEYVREDREIIANMFDAYVNAPDLLNKIAPNAKKAFDKILDDNPKYEFLRQIKPTVERGDEVIEKDVWGASDYAPKGTITVFENGKPQYYTVSKPILAAMENLRPAQLGFLEKIFSVPASVLRAGATLVPEFWIRNVLRDQTSALIQSGVRPTPIDMVKGLTALIGKKDLYNEWMKSGGSFNSYMELTDDGLEKAYKELFRPQGRLARYLRNPLNVPADISMSLEQGTRIGVYGKAKKAGMSDIEAALEAREATLDFARGGSKARVINRFIPFFNAGMQGTDKFIRTLKENPAAATFWGVATITMPSVFLAGYYLYGAPEDERKEYLEIPQWQRDMFWVFKSDGEWHRYPKPFTLGYAFGSVPERFMLWMYDGEKPEGEALWKDLVLGMGGALSPVYDASALLPPLLKVTIEDVTNYNFFTGRDIYPKWMEALEPEERKQKFTSKTAEAIGKKMGVSPAIIDNTLRGLIAGSADYVTGAGDFILDQVSKWNGEEVPEEPVTQSDMAIVKAFAVRDPTGYRAQSSQVFFDNWDEVGQKHATMGKKDGEEKAAYIEENDKLIRAYKPMKGFYDNIRELAKQIDKIYEDGDMSGDEKVAEIKTLEDQILDVSREANKWYSEFTKDNGEEN